MERATCCGLKTACCHGLMHIVHFLKDADRWLSRSPVWCRSVYTVCVDEIGVDGSITVLTVAEHVA